MAKRAKNIRPSSALLGKNIARLRIAKDMSRNQLGRMINKNEQQIAKYEAGEFIPLPVIEDIGKALDEPVPKKIIRKISFIRKLETEQNAKLDNELSELYNLAFGDIYDED
ncbi:MAG: helix-turn-helix transcriptional regulator [Rickettsiales bacterium]|nr:helix-turn-helix transcriptional regulator [Pseudomonadota bacterium]MDA0967290.1 helix-turn-helix transcriptional regulator [Pseudomonadota bacterium]MDG4544049.1 helix-turn-helix transcriptional regulator [Rickettsiales bacterium]MDG4546257.1 helix-turn-helix transcriptional regulator [Rickettsiales bacterium]MDG4548373.1 helix-turn-helix transcriptional regulator [Rickettsiales bacterium]